MASPELVTLVNALGAFGIKVQPIPDVVITPPPIPVAGTGKFVVRNGQIIDPYGKSFLALGINVYDSQQAVVCRNDACQPLLDNFPALNIVRLNCYSYADPSTFDLFVQRLTNKGIVVLFDDHTGISQPPYTGDRLTTEVTWFTNIARRYKDNTYVWINGFNEPGNGNNLPGITDQQVAIYNGIRSVSPDVINVLELPSGGNPGLVGTRGRGYDGSGPMPSSAYATMHNVVWGPHFYAWTAKYSTDRTTVQAALIGSVESASGMSAVQSITSADGVVPIIIGEFGDSTTGIDIDPDGSLVVDVVGKSGYGFIAWHWQAAINPGDLLTSGGVLTAYGKQVSALITAARGTVTPPVITPPPPTNTDITLLPGDGKTGTDRVGALWSLDSGGNVIRNTVALPGGAGTSSIHITGGIAVAYDGKTGVGYTWDGTVWNEVATTTTTPPVTTTPTTATGKPGVWLDGAVSGMPYKLLTPTGYDPNISYACMIYLHQLDWGIPNNVPALMTALNNWFNTPAFRAAHNIFVLAPLLDQSADPSGVSVNFGGVSANITDGREGVLRSLQSVKNAYNIDKSRVSITGNSLGGIGTWELIADLPNTFCAAMPLAGASYTRSVSATCTALKTKPIWAIHGSNDTNVPLDWDRSMYAQMQAIGGVMKYTEVTGAGHDVWDTVYLDTTHMNWLLSQSM
jgi:predicted esterase